ncbi:Dbl homology domain-containing protein [Basidiobolus meristosporus CBS 931.73]|uniref:Dbl homology domain-containing protein n=1 Tax=Basidiobolus meristosporus CBS 931.73 TaxID=1314790 RepID=A0A1Y1XBR3_9FUNG|nr:Dbl homology domain-containing protein [Basidiobolus meristosporus CBS 931.73]|eukprot:ORX82856.1 Dbl homology domain-containing protein [Basidiobolus meristosporus CBS 931.73]
MTQDPTKVYSSRSTAASLSETESDFSVQSNKNLSDNFLKHSPKGPPETGRPATQNQPHSEPRSSSAHKKEMEGKAKTYHFHPKYNFRSFHLFKTRKSSPSILNRSESGSSQTDSEGSMYSENDPWKKSGWGVLDLFESGSAQTKKKSYPELSSSQAAESKKDAKSFRSPFRRRSCTLDSIHRSFSVDEIQAQLNRTEKSDASIPARRSVSLEDDLPLISVAKAPVSGMSRAIQPEAGTIQRSHSQGSPASGKSAELTRNDSSVSLDTLSIYSDYSTRSDPAAPVSIGEKEPKRSQSLNAKYEKHVDKSPSQVTSPRLDLATESKKKIFTSKVFAASKHLRQGVRPVFNEGRFYVVDEILTTELNYLENLEIILNTFMIPIQKSAKSSHPIIPPRDTKIIFEGIESLYDLSQEICQELKDMVEHWDKETRVGVLFLRRQKAWEIYPRFVDNYSFAREAIRRAEATHSFYSFTKHVARKTTKRQTLKELLIIPIQRVTRYTLLLKDLRKQTKPDHPDFRNVEKALEFMTSLAVRVNEVKQREEERTQLFTMYNAVRNCPVSIPLGPESQRTSSNAYV